MKNNNVKKIAGRTKLFSAIGMFTVSAVMLASSTYAWFTMNKTVSVTNMQVKAKAEKGLLINEIATASDTNWDELATSSADTSFTLIPMSTKDGISWVHANSTKANSAAKATSTSAKSANITSSGYTFFTLASTAGGSNLGASGAAHKLDFNTTAASAGSQAQTDIYYQEKSGTGDTGNTIGDTDDGAFVKYSYYLKSSGSDSITVDATTNDEDGDKLYVKTITVSGLDKSTADGAGETDLAHNLDKTLRVGIKVNDGTNNHFYTFAPIEGADEDYFIATSDSGTFSAEADAVQTAKKSKTAADSSITCSATYSTGLEIGSLPSTTTDGKLVEVFLWYEGEDSNCNTDNIYTDLDELTVNIVFGLV